jgi:hypothetical protein
MTYRTCRRSLLLFLATSLLAAPLALSASRTVYADSPCNPSRSDGGTGTTYFEGWDASPGANVYGVSSDIYDYPVSAPLPPSGETPWQYQYVVLNGSSGNYATMGFLSNGDHNFPGGPDHSYVEQINEPTVGYAINYEGISPTVSGSVYFQVVDGLDIPNLFNFEYGSSISTFSETAYFTPNDSQVNFYDNDLADQSPGDVTYPASAADTTYYSGSAWHAFYGAATTWTSPSTDDFQGNYTKSVSGQGGTFYGFDIGCPLSQTSGDTLTANELLDSAGTNDVTTETLTSTGTTLTNGPYYLESQTNGNLGLYDGNGYALWSENGTTTPAAYLRMQPDNNLVLYNGVGNGVLWSSGTSGDGYASPYAKVQNDGNFVLYGDASHPLFASNTFWDSTNSGQFYGQTKTEGTTISSPNYNYHLSMQTDCNLVLYNASWSAIWASNTSGNGSSCHLDMQTDGNLVLYKYSGHNTALWNSGTGSTGSQDHMAVANSGSFSVYDVAGTSHYTS